MWSKGFRGFKKHIQSRLETVAKERARALPGAPSCAPGHLMGAEPDDTRLSQLHALLRPFAPSGAIVRGASHLGQRPSNDQGCRERARARFLATVSSRTAHLQYHVSQPPSPSLKEKCYFRLTLLQFRFVSITKL